MNFFSHFTKEVIETGILIVITLFLRIILARFIRRYAKIYSIMESRTNLVIKYIYILITIIMIIGIIIIWGVQKKDILLTISWANWINLGVGLNRC
jgi:cytochrome b561